MFVPMNHRGISITDPAREIISIFVSIGVRRDLACSPLAVYLCDSAPKLSHEEAASLSHTAVLYIAFRLACNLRRCIYTPRCTLYHVETRPVLFRAEMRAMRVERDRIYRSIKREEENPNARIKLQLRLREISSGRMPLLLSLKSNSLYLRVSHEK